MAGCVSSRPIAATEAGGALLAKMSSASCVTESKVSLLKVQWAIPARTWPGRCLFHKARTMAGQHLQSRSSKHTSLTKTLARSLGLFVRVLLKALSILASGRGPKILMIVFFSCL